MTKKDKNLSEDKLEDILDILHEESDRACAVLGAAYVDFLLAKAVARAMPQGAEVADRLLYNPEAPLGTFSSRIDTAYGLGLVDSDSREDLHKIRTLRNDFAHDLEVRPFDQSDGIRDRC